MTEELAKLQETFNTVADYAKTFPEELRTTKPTDVAFSATEILYHLLTVESLWQQRIKQLITTQDRQFERFDPDAAAREMNHNAKPYDKGLEAWFEARVETIDLIEEMSESERRIIGLHPKFGELDTHAIVRIMQEHDLNHLGQFKRTLEAITKAQ